MCFIPGGNCPDLMLNAVGEAKTSILVQATSFTSALIANALLDAHTRGVQGQVILPRKSQRAEKYCSSDVLANHGVPMTIDAEHAIAHNKIIIIDSTLLSWAALTSPKRRRR